MEKSFQKLLKTMLSKKYPIYLDVHIYHSDNKIRWSCYEVFLIVFDEDYEKLSREQIDEVKEYVKTLSKYMDIKICGVYYETVDKEEWEEMKSPIKN